MPVLLENWSVGVFSNVYQAPEMRSSYLTGTVYGHPRKKDGTEIDTTPIAAVNGLLVTTRTGTVYQLGAPNPEYLSWLKENNIPFDPAEPIKEHHGSPQKNIK